MIKYMPIDKSSMDIISPIFDLSTKGNSFMEGLNSEFMSIQNPGYKYDPVIVAQQQRTMLKPVKRSVSETKKKYVASSQNWKCGKCNQQLNHTFEIDHKMRLEYGGTNEVDNLIALCRNCHGEKTAMENM
jgi:5-methylcytosine-specific restriction endonuclease McrA